MYMTTAICNDSNKSFSYGAVLQKKNVNNVPCIYNIIHSQIINHNNNDTNVNALLLFAVLLFIVMACCKKEIVL